MTSSYMIHLEDSFPAFEPVRFAALETAGGQ